MKRAARGCALASATVVLAVAAGLVGLELYFRGPGAGSLGIAGEMRGLYENDGAGSIRTVAGFRAPMIVEGRTTQIRINAIGLRGPEVAAKAAGERRVLVLGDSMVFGIGVEDEETFPARLAQRLSRSLGVPVTGGNAGMPANGTLDQVRDLRRHLPTFAPDVVVTCVYLWNDFDDDVFGPREVVEGYSFGTAGARFVKSSWRARLALRSRVALRLEMLLADKLPSLAIDRSPIAPTPEEAARADGLPDDRSGGIFLDVAEVTPPMARALDRVESAVRQIRDLARPSEVVCAVLPAWIHVLPGAYEAQVRAMGLDPSEHRLGRVQERLAERCAREGVPCVDLAPSMRQRPDVRSLYFPADRHLTVAGHEHVAGVLEPIVRERLETLDRSARPATMGSR